MNALNGLVKVVLFIISGIFLGAVQLLALGAKLLGFFFGGCAVLGGFMILLSHYLLGMPFEGGDMLIKLCLYGVGAAVGALILDELSILPIAYVYSWFERDENRIAETNNYIRK